MLVVLVMAAERIRFSGHGGIKLLCLEYIDGPGKIKYAEDYKRGKLDKDI